MLESFRFHHIGIAVRSIEQTATIYVAGGYRMSTVIADQLQNVNICWLSKDGMPLVELLEPIDETSPVCKTLEKIGVTPYHICYCVDNIDETVSELKRMKYVVVAKPTEAIAINNSRVCFLFNKNIGLIELVEMPAKITE